MDELTFRRALYAAQEIERIDVERAYWFAMGKSYFGDDWEPTAPLALAQHLLGVLEIEVD